MALPQATLPVAGVVYNVNYDLGQNGIVGIKTGSTPSGGDFAFDANVTTTFGKEPVLGVVLGQLGTAPLITALNVGKTIAASVGAIPSMKTFVTQGEKVGKLVSADGKSVSLKTSAAVTLQSWAGLSVSATEILKKLSYPVPSGSVVGELQVRVGMQTKTVNLLTGGALAAPTLSWRLLRL
jgi:D-alanyl-D-alanine carboxypeptidase (penicillin-binding protein 5/6)